MAEQREPEGASDWRHKLAAFVTEILHGDDRHKEWLWNAAHAFAAGDPVPKPDAAPIPSNEELIALRAVAEAARAFMYHTVKNASKSKGWPYEEMAVLQDALARLG